MNNEQLILGLAAVLKLAEKSQDQDSVIECSENLYAWINTLNIVAQNGFMAEDCVAATIDRANRLIASETE